MVRMGRRLGPWFGRRVGGFLVRSTGLSWFVFKTSVSSITDFIF